jgi:hypothetical protein
MVIKTLRTSVGSPAVCRPGALYAQRIRCFGRGDVEVTGARKVLATAERDKSFSAR